MAKRSGGGNKGKQKSPTGRLRIVAGNWRSRVLEIVDAPGLRPTSERIRESLFNWLAPRIDGARCLDLFAGTGALGLEALSRGAADATFVEAAPEALRALRQNIGALDATCAEVFAGDAVAFIEQPRKRQFDIVFIDPPFADDRLAEMCRLIDERNLLAAGGRVYLEQDRSRPAPELPDGWTTLRSKTAGNVRYSLVTPAAHRNGENDE